MINTELLEHAIKLAVCSTAVENEKPISMIELGEIYTELCKNEDKLYPKSEGKMGSDMIENFLSDVKKAGKVTDDIKRKYFLK